jgi:hypothetical protein
MSSWMIFAGLLIHCKNEPLIWISWLDLTEVLWWFWPLKPTQLTFVTKTIPIALKIYNLITFFGKPSQVLHCEKSFKFWIAMVNKIQKHLFEDSLCPYRYIKFQTIIIYITSFHLYCHKYIVDKITGISCNGQPLTWGCTDLDYLNTCLSMWGPNNLSHKAALLQPYYIGYKIIWQTPTFTIHIDQQIPKIQSSSIPFLITCHDLPSSHSKTLLKHSYIALSRI